MIRSVCAYSLVEVMVSTLILLIALAGFAPLLANFMRYSRSLEMRHVGQKILERDVSRLRVMEVEDFTEDNIKTLLGYSEALPSGWNDINSSCDSEYETVLYREDNSTRWNYLLKLCLDENYLDPYLKRAQIWIYWKDRGKIRKIKGLFFVGATR